MRITEKAVKIINEIDKNPNQTIMDISRKTGLSKQIVSYIVIELIKDGRLEYENKHVGKFTLKI